MRRTMDYIDIADEDDEPLTTTSHSRANRSTNANSMIIAHTMGDYNGDSDSVGYDTLPAHKRNVLYWDPVATRTLIKLRFERDNEFDSNCGRKGQMWVEISERMSHLGYDFGVDKVSKKWHNILMTYKKNVVKKTRTGRVNWEYFEELDAILGEHHNNGGVGGIVDGGADGGDGDWDDSYDASDMAVTMMDETAGGAATSSTSPDDENHAATRAMDNASPLLVPLVFGKRKSMRNSGAVYYDEGSVGSPMPPEKKRIQRYPAAEFVPNYESVSSGRYEQKMKLESTAAAAATAADSNDATDDGGASDGESVWMREYFRQKLELERERLKSEQDRHRDYMNFQKMTLMLQEKMEKNKLDALRNLTDAINRLV